MMANRGLRVTFCGPLFGLALVLCSGPNAAAATITAIDSFVIVRNGALFFNDPFTDGLEPPSAPNFPNGIPASYRVGGTFPSTAETGGKLALNSSLGEPFVNAAGQHRSTQSATLRTNTDSLDTTVGLKEAHTFLVQGLFDLTAPVANSGNYGTLVADATGIDPGDERIQVQVIRRSDDVVVEFFRQDFLTHTTTIIGTELVDFTLGDQIMLSIEHPIVNTDDFVGSFQYFAGGVPVGDATELGTTTMFRGENHVLADFFAAEAVVAANVPATLVLVIAGLSVTWVRHRRLRM